MLNACQFSTLIHANRNTNIYFENKNNVVNKGIMLMDVIRTVTSVKRFYCICNLDFYFNTKQQPCVGIVSHRYFSRYKMGVVGLLSEF